MMKVTLRILSVVYCLFLNPTAAREAEVPITSSSPQVTEEEIRTFKAEPNATHILFRIKERTIETGKHMDNNLVPGAINMYYTLNKFREYMPTRSEIEVSAEKPIFAGMNINITSEDSIHVTAPQQIRLSLSLCDTSKDAVFTAPWFGVDMFFVTAKEDIKILAPQGSKGWLQGLIIKHTASFERPFTFMLRGDIDFNQCATLEDFLVVGAGEIDFLVRKSDSQIN
ncbi:hypothetical protein [Candidatus Odyssella acanthamoebae]|uniref:Lipid/polyisoprenoid-binding YceI-like domain-containing protein n=1 Tax=Candidatus Odyssella acanthamoebae TaxID=91604 RepID=A0A077AYS2_9PROT|nr:hypothetical protein [Candidatus Paracaedibacter acanthamoebae]AIK96783.1 hypothetical protein ID47_08675 [Candidatus Paracaedibacter acanthamoebae]